ncbi:unnamed protein product [Schistosoma mattheei]|uniref:Uncharacterized protein n=1 Tax=Schistosoma mattheei TaxID=31246 RepID=A0A3P8CCQ5_9TREM|nr:unnamed protein product [Schistosoma mattheei]
MPKSARINGKSTDILVSSGSCAKSSSTSSVLLLWSSLSLELAISSNCDPLSPVSLPSSCREPLLLGLLEEDRIS